MIFDIAKTAYYGYGAFTGDKSAFYQQDAGPYNWQEKGSWKGWNVLGKNVALSGDIWSPASAIENRFSRIAKK